MAFVMGVGVGEETCDVLKAGRVENGAVVRKETILAPGVVP